MRELLATGKPCLVCGAPDAAVELEGGAALCGPDHTAQAERCVYRQAEIMRAQLTGEPVDFSRPFPPGKPSRWTSEQEDEP
jgi:hypothetical protein